jgi:DNA helicase-2/ATP-dependent DNA helicase PcrA
MPSSAEAETAEIYDHLVIDEVQDFGAVELTVLLAAVRTRTGVTIAGDLNQKIIPEADFIGWDALARELGIEGARVSRLAVAHRATAQIMALADSVLGDGRDDQSAFESEQAARASSPRDVLRPGPVPSLTIVEAPNAQLERAAEHARSALRDRPNAHVVVVCRHARDVRPTHGYLAERLAGSTVRIGHNESFVFDAGVTVTNLRQVKGLEFDAVVVLDVTEPSYPASDQGRRHLYTVLTRAKDRVDLVCVGEPSSLLAPGRAQGLVEVTDLVTVEPVKFTLDEEEPI